MAKRAFLLFLGACTLCLFIAALVFRGYSPFSHGKFGKKFGLTGLYSQTRDDVTKTYEATRVRAIVDDIDRVKDPVFPNDSIHLSLVFYDVYGFQHKYPARIGAKLVDGSKMLLAPLDKGDGHASIASIEEVRTVLHNGTLVVVSLLYHDRTKGVWSETEHVNACNEFYDHLFTALGFGKHFPSAQKSCVFQIISLQILARE